MIMTSQFTTENKDTTQHLGQNTPHVIQAHQATKVADYNITVWNNTIY